MAKKKSKKKEESLFKQIPNGAWAIIALIILGVALWGFFSSLDKFTYKELAFTKERYGEIIVNHYSYFFYDQSGQLAKYNLYLRGDPRDNEVPLDAEITYEENDILLSIDTDNLVKCEDSVIALPMLQDFLRGNGFKVQLAVPEVSQNDEHEEFPVANCQTHPGRTLILLEEGEQTRVYQDDRCYVIEINSCEIQPAVEKFLVESLAQERARNN